MPTLDGSIADWTPQDRLDTAATGTAGYALYARYQDAKLHFALTADAVAIGANTTIWLDTDLNRTSGYQIWGFTGGAEYNVNIGSDGIARLFTGGAGETLVAELPSALSADGRVLELSIDVALIGGATQTRVYADINDSAFLPTSYATANLIVTQPPAVDPVPEVVGTITLDGGIGDWSAAARLDTAATGTAGYALYGDVQGGSLVFAIAADAVAVGTNTTIWLDTDLNRASGYQIFGFTGGAEYNINIGTDGIARLYSGGAGENFVADIPFARSADGRVVEIAVPSSLIGGATAARVYADVNDTAYLPNDYTNVDIIVREPVVQLPDDPAMRVGIVYSATTADNFYDKTAYGQLFMSMQSQAIQAGIPFTLLTEDDLKDPANLAGFDALVFPGMSHVKAGDLAAISASLQTAASLYGVGMIAAGNFLTNDETGAAFAGDSYARMKSLLGVTLESSAATNGVTLVADGGLSPILDGYAPGEVVGTYTNTGYQAFTPVVPLSEVLFSQIVSGPAGSTLDVPAVIATQGATRNVHFASDAAIGNNNILQEALQWVARDDTPDIALEITRGTSLFSSRNDMDQSQETFDVEGGIYTEMNAILSDWYAKYGFVGSYYINVGANPPDQQTDWAVSSPFYRQLLAMGNEIGSHSYTHPDNTNLLLSDTPEILALIARVDPRNPGHVDASTLSTAEKDMLFSSYRFQFETSRLIIEEKLGIPITGAAVPGAPERLDASREMIKFYDYLSGGYSGIGAGYPNAFGYLTPADTGGVYLAPNMSFDFSLIEFQNLTPEQARAQWLKEFASITDHGNTPITVFPWHDYGLTDWDLGGSVDYSYPLEMFEIVISTAAASGAEFVTGQDLADRIDSFHNSGLTATQSGNVITATVASSDAGNFALGTGDGRIASVANWYAWDEDQVFLPRAGGTFQITLGATPADVTHISELPMRAELLSVSGNGKNLSAKVHGNGEMEITLASQGSQAVVITGAAGGDVVDKIATLRLDGISDHTTTVQYRSGGLITGTSGRDFYIGGSAADRISAGGGNDTVAGGGNADRLNGGAGADRLIGGKGNDMLTGGAGADTFVFAPGAGFDTVLDFNRSSDLLELSLTGFANAAEVVASFVDTLLGMELRYGNGDRLLLLGENRADVTAANIVLHQPLDLMA